MRIKWYRHFTMATLFLIAHFGAVGCSSTGSEEGDTEAVEENVSEDGAENAAAAEEGNVPAANTALNNGQADTSGGDVVVAEEAAPAADSAAGNPAAGGNSTEGDLQSIISEMNGATPSANGGNAAASAPAAVADAGAPAAEVAAPAEAAPATPVATPSVVGLPEMGAKMAYVVQQGDTLSKIAARVYGDMKRWRELADLTGVANPSRIYPGDVIYYALDESSKSFAQTYESLRRGVTTVQAGETLATISKRVYGKHRNWKSIWRQNDVIDDPHNLTPGTTIYYVTQDQLSAALKKSDSVKMTLNKSKKSQNSIATKIKGGKSSAKILADVWESAKPFSMLVMSV
jgi:nucleoid-associated protein YgaU